MGLKIIYINNIYTIIYLYRGWAMRIYVLAYAYIRLGEFLYTSWQTPI